MLGGHDPSAAGVQADIETCAALGRLALSVVTALTTQNTAIVHKVIPSRPEDVSDQIRTGLDEFKPDACKIGLVPNSAISAVIAGILKNELRDCPTVIDPVTKAGSGGSLALVDMIDALMSYLIPLAEVLTPNAGEVRALTSCDDLEHRASRLRLTGCESVLVTDAEGGKEVLINQLYIRDEPPERHEMKRLRGSYHGTGCTRATAIACHRAAGLSIRDAVA
ncbi:MAG: hydroxymethylpyrimidine/phosphomethylpyrimidine kinase [Gammaproteobacteria bacterium]